MIIAKTAKNKTKATKAIGKRFPFIQRLTRKELGKMLLVLDEASQGILVLAGLNAKQMGCYIEPRERGILVELYFRNETYIWPIPYPGLSVYKSGNRVSLYAHGHYLRWLDNDPDNEVNKNKVNYLIDLTAKFNEEHDFQRHG